ncbi:MAG: hypothetical protein SWX82_28290, partial [Cyanobacteriota bacterium]|nr:hypothetical protein [Cyanobacteriota bacterium]
VLEEFEGNHPVRASCSPETPETLGNTEQTPETLGNTEEIPETLGNTEQTPETLGNTEYEEKKKIADNCQKVYDLVEKAQELIGGEKPFNHPYYWAGFVCQGEG